MAAPRNRKDLKSEGQRLALTRKALDLGQAELARLLEISPQRLNNYEQGMRPIDIDVAKEMVRRWKLSLDWFYLADESSLPKHVIEKIAEVKTKKRV